MRKGLGRGAFICGVRRSLDPSTSVEGLLVAGVLPVLSRRLVTLSPDSVCSWGLSAPALDLEHQ